MDAHSSTLKLSNPVSLCSGGSCPTVYEVDGEPDLVAVQGYVRAIDRNTPQGEQIVLVERALLESVFKQADSSLD